MPVADSVGCSPTVIRLRHDDSQGRVAVEFPDKHVMAVSVQQAVEACRAFVRSIEFRDQFEHLLQMLGEWISEHPGKISDAYVTQRDAGLLFLVVQESSTFDSKLEDDLTELDLAIANNLDFKLVDLSVLALPNCSQETVASFLSRHLRVRYEVDGGEE